MPSGLRCKHCGSETHMESGFLPGSKCGTGLDPAIRARTEALEHERTTAAYESAIRADERAKIVAWLRGEGDIAIMDGSEREDIADAIERGDYLK